VATLSVIPTIPVAGIPDRWNRPLPDMFRAPLHMIGNGVATVVTARREANMVR
jgi:hypothetical protein